MASQLSGNYITSSLSFFFGILSNSIYFFKRGVVFDHVLESLADTKLLLIHGHGRLCL